MKKGRTIFLAVLLIVVLAGAFLGYQLLSEKYQPPQQSLQQPEEAEGPAEAAGEDEETETEEIRIDFSVRNEAGEFVNLSDSFGKPIVIDFWATWCSSCKSGLPAFEKAYEAYGEQVEFFMVNLTDGQQETIEIVDAFLEENGYEFPVYYDTEFSAAYSCGVSSIPLSVFIDRDGVVVKAYIGTLSETILEENIQFLLSQKEE